MEAGTGWLRLAARHQRVQDPDSQSVSVRQTDVAAETIQAPKTRGVGRPRATFGSSSVRAAFREHKAKLEADQPSDTPAQAALSPSPPSSMEIFRWKYFAETYFPFR